MSKQLNIDFFQINLHPKTTNNKNLRQLNDQNLKSSNNYNSTNSSNLIKQNQKKQRHYYHNRKNTQIVDFQQYLRTEHQLASQSELEESVGFQESIEKDEKSFVEELEVQRSQDRQMIRRANDNSKRKQTKKLVIELGENYTFADESSYPKRFQNTFDNKNLVHNLTSLAKKCTKNNNNNLKLQKNKSFKQQTTKFTQNYKSPTLKPSNQPKPFPFNRPLVITSHSQLTSDKISNFSSQFNGQNPSQSSKQISLSDNQDDNALQIYKQKQIQQQMFYKISEQTKEILELQQKLYYFEDFCKRLLKSQQESQRKIEEYEKQYSKMKKKVKQKGLLVKKLEENLEVKEKEIFQLRTKYLIEKNKRCGPFNSNSPPTNNQNRLKRQFSQCQRNPFLQQQNILPYNKPQNHMSLLLSTLQSQHLRLQQSYTLLLSKNTLTQQKNIQLLQQLSQIKEQNKLHVNKIKKFQNMNKVLEREIFQLNAQILQFEKEIEMNTCKKYKGNLERMKWNSRKQ